MIKIGIIGAAGYSGIELIKLLLKHPNVNIEKLFGNTNAGKNINEIHPQIKSIFSKYIEVFDEKKLKGLDCVFVALPSGQSYDFIKIALEHKIKIIDIGGDFRLRNVNEYKKYYHHDHKYPELLSTAIYGLPEWNEENIKNADLICNPGCYPTSVLLALLPVLKNNLINVNYIFINSYSGTSGAGKSLTQNMLFTEVNENIRAYKLGTHQHIPEIRQYAKEFADQEIKFTFIPHLLPVSRGIYTTIHTKIKQGIHFEHINEAFMNNYAKSKFIRLCVDEIPEMKNVLHTNFCDIGYRLIDDNLVIISTIDNLVKGAAGQAVQNMNLLFNFSKESGLL